MRSIKQITFSGLLIAALALTIFIYQYKSAYNPWPSDITYLVDKAKVVVPYNQVIVIIDHPLYKE